MTPSATAQARVLLELDRFAEARQLLVAHLASDPEDVDALCLLAQAHLGAGDHRQAYEVAAAAVRARPDGEWPHRLAGLAAVRLGQFEDAVRHADEAIRQAPTQWRTLVARAEVDVGRKKVSSNTESIAREAVRMAPHEAMTHARLGNVLFERKRYAAADAAVREALRLDPQNTFARNELARIALKGKRFGTAAVDFSAAAGLHPRDNIAAANLVVAAHRIVLRVDLTIVGTFWVVTRFHDQHNNPPIGAVRLAWVVCVVLTALFLLRMRRELGSHASRILRQAAHLNRVLAVWALTLAAILVVYGLAAVTPYPLNARLEVVGLVFLLLAVILTWVSRARIARTGRRNRRPRSRSKRDR